MTHIINGISVIRTDLDSYRSINKFVSTTLDPQAKYFILANVSTEMAIIAREAIVFPQSKYTLEDLEPFQFIFEQTEFIAKNHLSIYGSFFSMFRNHKKHFQEHVLKPYIKWYMREKIEKEFNLKLG